MRVHTDEGITGIGEVDSGPTVARAIIESPLGHKVWSGLAELLIGEDPLNIRPLWDKMFAGTVYNGRSGAVVHALSGLDLALWDIAGKALKQPVYRLLGGGYRTRVRAYASSLFGDTPEKTFELGRQYVLQGFTAVKFGWGPFGRDETLDMELASAAREGVGRQADLMFDVGGAWDWKTAIRREEKLRAFGPLWIEEPLSAEDLAGYAKLTECSRTLIAAGESEADLPAFDRLIREGGVDVVQPDVARCGGLTGAMRVADIASFCRRQVANHAFKTGISIAASLHFLAAIPNALILEYSVSDSPLRQRATVQTFPVVDGYVEIPRDPGLGVDLNMETIEEYRWIETKR